jgi:hypothetical protein
MDSSPLRIVRILRYSASQYHSGHYFLNEIGHRKDLKRGMTLSEQSNANFSSSSRHDVCDKISSIWFRSRNRINTTQLRLLSVEYYWYWFEPDFHSGGRQIFSGNRIYFVRI